VVVSVVAEVEVVKGRASLWRAGEGSKRRSRISARVWGGRDGRVEMGGSFSGRDMVVCLVWTERGFGFGRDGGGGEDLMSG